MEHVLTVSQFVELINVALEAVQIITVEGEVNEFKIIHHRWVTFKLRDEESAIDCFMPVWQYKAQIEDGMLVKAYGRPRLRPKGFFSFVLESVEPSGEGALKRTFELLRQKLESEGLFALERKRLLPLFPQHIALITSRDAAAYNDFVKVLQARQGGLTVSFIHTQVQGVDAPRQIIEALSFANIELTNLDVVVLVRGGGSLEDLAAFNDESVVRAVTASRTPIIVGVGHERDVTLADLAADVRASTPSNAAELLVKSRQEIVLQLQAWQQQLTSRLTSLTSKVDAHLQEYRTLLSSRVSQTLQQQRTVLLQLARVLRSFSPQATLERGYSITRMSGEKILREPKQVKIGITLSTQVAKGFVRSTVVE